MATTWDPANKDASITLSGGNLTADQPSPPGFRSVLATTTHSTLKYMVSQTMTNYAATGPDTPLGIGFGLATANTGSYCGVDLNSLGFYPASGHVYINNSVVATYALGGGSGDIFDLCIDFTNSTFWVRRNGGNWNNNASADPATNTLGLSISSLNAGAKTPMAAFNGAPSVATITTNFGASSFTYAIPSGFTAWDPGVTPVAVSAVVGAQSKSLSALSAVGAISARIQAASTERNTGSFSAAISSRVQASATAKAFSAAAVAIAARVGAMAKGVFAQQNVISISARVTVQSKAMQDIPAVFSASGLWRTDALPSQTSTYIEAKEPMTWIYETVLLPDNLVMAMNAINESNISFAFLGDSPVVTITAKDTNDQVIDTVTVTAPGTTTLWNEFNWNEAPWDGTGTNLSPWRLPWTEPIVFKQMAISATGLSEPGLKIGNLYMRYQILGYRQQRPSGVR